MKIVLLNGGPRKNGATNRLVELFSEQLQEKHEVESICLGDKAIGYCNGCKACYIKGECCQKDDTDEVVRTIYHADAVIVIVPSYWAEIPGQMKVFIDRCTPYGNMNPKLIPIPHTTKGYAVALRTGTNPAECEGIINMMKHYFGHMEIEVSGSAYFCGIDVKEDIDQCKDEIVALCRAWITE